MRQIISVFFRLFFLQQPSIQIAYFIQPIPKNKQNYYLYLIASIYFIMDILSSQNIKVKSKLYVYFIVLNCVLGSFLFGYEMMNVGCLKDLIEVYNKKNISGLYTESVQFSIITSTLPLGAFIAMFFTKRFLNYFGERKAFIYLDIVAILFIIYQATSLSFFVQSFSRFFLGFIIGLNSAIIPKYIISLSPISMSGAMGSLNQLFITIGIAFAYIVGFLVEGENVPQTSPWRYVIVLPILTCVIRAVLLIFHIPFDSLDRHYKNQQLAMIENYCMKMYIGVTAQQYIKLMKFNESKVEQGNKIVLNNSGYKKRYLLAIMIALSSQFSGINSILFYANQIFNKITNDDKHLSQICSFSLGVVQIIVTLISGLYLDKWGKRVYMLAGQSVILFTLFSIFILDTFDLVNVSGKIFFLIFFIFFHIIGFSLSLGPIVWIYISQILKEQEFIIAMIWFVTFLVAIFTGTIIKFATFGYLSLIYFALEGLCFIYIYLNMKETKGKNEKEIEQMFEDIKSTKTIQSNQEGLSIHDEQ